MADRSGVRRWLGLAVAAAALVLAAPADAQIEGAQSADRWVTIVARECDDYADITANLARNDIMESLQDLGPDTLYESGEPIDPRTELEGQPTCRPITGWRFTFGSGIRERAVSGPWGALSIVTDPDSGQQPVTKATVPARDFNGNPVPGGVKIEGAVTIGLNRDQVDRASANNLWLQGGTQTDPVLYADPAFAGHYGFGALRCAIDNLNGDNVETIQFPSGTRHMYCYAYYVTPPPSSGTIIIRKEVEGSETRETFAFTGNVSYNENGAFNLSAAEGDPDSIEFVRAETGTGDAPWTVVEAGHDGWTLTGIDCTSQSSATTTNLAARSVAISLTAGDTVTCTFNNALTPPAGALVLRKVTRDGAGTFRFRIRDEDGDVVARPRLTTRAPGPVGAARVITLDAGRYRISERRPGSREGVWRLVRLSCNGEARPTDEPAEVRISGGRGAVCTFTNRLDRPGRIRIGMASIRGIGTAGYVVTSRAAGFQRRQFARTRRQLIRAPARGQSTTDLAFGRYTLQQTAITAAQRRVWSLIAVTCNGRVVPWEQGRVDVRLTRRDPEQRCTFVNLRRRDPDPPPDPVDPTPPPDPVPVPGENTPDLVLDKQLVRSSGGPIPTLTFRIRVTNRSAVTAENVTVADRLASGTALVSADPSQGRCFTRGPRLLICPLGDLDPGERVTIRVRVQQFDPSAGVNVAAAGASSPEDTLRNNIDIAGIAAVRRRSGACPSRFPPPLARAAC